MKWSIVFRERLSLKIIVCQDHDWSQERLWSSTPNIVPIKTLVLRQSLMSETFLSGINIIKNPESGLFVIFIHLLLLFIYFTLFVICLLQPSIKLCVRALSSLARILRVIATPSLFSLYQVFFSSLTLSFLFILLLFSVKCNVHDWSWTDNKFTWIPCVRPVSVRPVWTTLWVQFRTDLHQIWNTASP